SQVDEGEDGHAVLGVLHVERGWADGVERGPPRLGRRRGGGGGGGAAAAGGGGGGGGPRGGGGAPRGGGAGGGGPPGRPAGRRGPPRRWPPAPAPRRGRGSGGPARPSSPEPMAIDRARGVKLRVPPFRGNVMSSRFRHGGAMATPGGRMRPGGTEVLR